MWGAPGGAGDGWRELRQHSGVELALTGAGDEINGGWSDIPNVLRQSIGVQLAMFGSNSKDATAVTITSIAVAVKNVDQASAAQLLPTQVLPAEKLAADGRAVRGYSPQDIADIGFAATPMPTGPHRHQLY